MKNLWRYSGWYLLFVGVVHNLVGLIFGWYIISNIMSDGLINTIYMEYDRNFIFWFLAIGFMWMMMGVHWQNIIRTSKKPLPAYLGWVTLILTIAGLLMYPASGIWLFLPLVCMLLQPHMKLQTEKRI